LKWKINIKEPSLLKEKKLQIMSTKSSPKKILVTVIR